MGIFRKISNIGLLVATMLLLMNSILPHHHHQEDVCFVANHCSSEITDLHKVEFEHNGVKHDHHDDQSDICQVVNFYLTPASKNLVEKAKLKCFNKNQYLFTLLNSNEVILGYLHYQSANIFIADQIGLNSKCLTRALRAPPCC